MTDQPRMETDRLEDDSSRREPGRCVGCGCTECAPCDGGCSWADEDRTLCSVCASQQLTDAAIELGKALAALTCAIYVLEEVSGDLQDDVRMKYDEAFADVGRLYANIMLSSTELLADHPEARAAARSEPIERKIVTP